MFVIAFMSSGYQCAKSSFNSLMSVLVQNKPGSADVLRSMEMFALQAARRLSREDMVEPTLTNNIGELDLLIVHLY